MGAKVHPPTGQTPYIEPVSLSLIRQCVQVLSISVASAAV